MDYGKLNKRIEYLVEHERDDYFLNIDLKPDIQNKLFDYQVLHVMNLMAAFRLNKVIIDTSDTGTGKTYTSIAFCKQQNLRPFIICPKILINNWTIVCKLFGVNSLVITNYESIRKKGINNEYLQLDTVDDKYKYKWTLPISSIVIFDEVHRCKNKNSINGQLLLSTRTIKQNQNQKYSKNQDPNVLMLSATIADTPANFFVFGLMLQFFKTPSQAKSWTKSLMFEDGNDINQSNKSSALSEQLYPAKGSHMVIKELGSKFPTNQISMDCYRINDELKHSVNMAFDVINQHTVKLTAANNQDNHILEKIMMARQQIEIAKLSIIKKLANEYMENNCSVVIFVNFVDSLKKLAVYFKTDCVIFGDQTDDERQANIDKFQCNESNIIICTLQSGGIGISLHDLHGTQRVSIISPSFSSYDLIQALGRIHRVGSLTPAIQRVIFCHDTCETVICNRLKEKIKFMETLNDNDLVVGVE